MQSLELLDSRNTLSVALTKALVVLYALPVTLQAYAQMPKLGVALPVTVREDAGTLTNAGLVSVSQLVSSNVVVQVQLIAGTSEVSMPGSVVLGAGQTNVAFDITVTNKTGLTGPREVLVTVFAQGFSAVGPGKMEIVDVEPALLVVALPPSAHENDQRVTGQVQLGTAPVRDVAVRLFSANTNQLTVPATITLRAGTTSAVFIATIQNNRLLDGTRSVSVSATVSGWEPGFAGLQLFDDEPRVLTLNISDVVEGEGLRTNAVVLGAGGIAVIDLPVLLTLSDTNILSVPREVIIPSGRSNVCVSVVVLDNGTIDGFREVTVEASFDDFTGASRTVRIWDNDAHHFEFSPLSPLQNTDQPITATILAKGENGELLTNFFGKAWITAEGLEGQLPMDNTNAVAFYAGQGYCRIGISAPGTGVTFKLQPGKAESDPFNVERPMYQVLNQTAADLAWHESSQTLFGTVPAGGGAYSNQIVAIDVRTCAVANAYPLGEDPDTMEISPDDGFLYARSQDRSRLYRFDLATRKAGITIAPGRFISDFAVIGGMKDSVVLACTDGLAGVWRYDSGTPVELTSFSPLFPYMVQSASTKPMLYAYQGNNPYPLMRGAAMPGSSVVVSNGVFDGREITWRDGVLYDDTGRAVEADTFALLGEYPGAARGRALATTTVEVDPQLRRTYYFNAFQDWCSQENWLKVYDRDLFEPVAQIKLPLMTNAPVRLVRCGTNGLAFNTRGGGIWLMRSALFDPKRTPVELQVSQAAVTLPALVGSNFNFWVAVSNAGPGVATVVNVTNTLPANVSGLSFSPSAGTAYGTNGGFTWKIPALAPGATATLNVMLRPGTAGWQTNMVRVVAFESDPVYTNNRSALSWEAQLPANELGAFPLAIGVQDMIYDPARDRLLVAVAGGKPKDDSGLVVLNPYNGLIEQFVGLPHRPFELKSAGGRHLYVSSKDDAVVQRLDLATLQTNLTFGLGGWFYYDTYVPLYAAEMLPIPGSPDSIVVWRVSTPGQMWSEGSHGLAVFDNGVMRTNVTPALGQLALGYDQALGRLYAYHYGADAYSNFRDFHACTVDENGVTLGETLPRLAYNAGTSFKYAAGRFFMNSGQAFETSPLTLAAVYGGSEKAALVEPDEAARRVFYLVKDQGWQLKAHEMDSARLLGSLAVSNVLGTPENLLRWGTNGLVFRTTSNQLFVVRTALAQPGAGADLELRFQGPAGPVATNTEFAFEFSVRNVGPAQAFSLRLGINVPTGLSMVSSECSTGTITESAESMSWAGSSLPAGESVRIGFVGKAMRAGSLNLTANVTADTLDPVPANSTVVASIQTGTATEGVAASVLQLPVADLVWSPVTGKLLATVSSNSPNWAGSLVSLDPATLQARHEAALGPGASRLVTEGTRLYAALEHSIDALDLPSFAARSRFPLDLHGRLLRVGGMALLSDSRSLVVGRVAESSSDLAIYDEGVIRSNAAALPRKEFALTTDGVRLFVQNTPSPLFQRYATPAGGPILLDEMRDLIASPAKVELEWADGVLLTSDGKAVNPDKRTRIGEITTVQSGSACCYDPSTGRAYYLSTSGRDAFLQAVDVTTLIACGSLQIPSVSGDPLKIVRWGERGIAFATSGGQVFSLQTALVPAGVPADLQINTRTASPLAFVGSNFVYSVLVTNAGPGAAPNSQVLASFSGNPRVSDARTSQGSCAVDGPQVVANLGSLAAGATATVNVAVVASEPGAIMSLFKATSSTADPIATNGIAGLTNSVLLQVVPGATVMLPQTSPTLAYSPVTKRLYLGTADRQIAVINPAYAQTEAFWPLPSIPSKLRVAPDGSRLYMALDEGRRIGIVDLASGALHREWSLGTNDGAAYVLEDMAVRPGSPESLVVIKEASGAFYSSWLELYTNGVLAMATDQQRSPPEILRFAGEPNTFYDQTLRRYAIETGGFREIDVPRQPSPYREFEFDGGHFFSTTGLRIDPPSRITIAAYEGTYEGSLVAPDVAHGRVCFLSEVRWSGWQLRVYEPDTCAFMGSVVVTNVAGRPRDLVRWGDDGIAFCTTGNQLFIMRSLFLPSGPPADLALGQEAMPRSATAGQPMTFRLSVTNNGPNSAADVVLLDRLPTNTIALDLRASKGSITQYAGLVTCRLGTLASGDVAQVEIQLRPQCLGNLRNTATVWAAVPDPLPGNNNSTETANSTLVVGADGSAVLDLQTADIAYDPVSGTLCAALLNYSGAYSGAVIGIDPSSGALGRVIPVGAGVTRIAVSEDGAWLYALEGNWELRRIRLSDGAIDVRTPTPMGKELKLVPGQPRSILVHDGYRGTIYDDGLARTNGTIYAANVDFYAPNWLLASDSSAVRLELTPEGVYGRSEYAYQLVDGVIQGAGGLVYTTAGSVIDPLQMKRIYNYGVSGLVLPDANANRICFLSMQNYRPVLEILDLAGFYHWSTRVFTNAVGEAARLIRCGGDRVAFRTSGGQVFIVRDSSLPTEPESDLLVDLSMTGSSRVRGRVDLDLVVRNTGSNSTSMAMVHCSLPPGFIPVSSVVSQGTMRFGDTGLNWDLGALPASASATNTVSFTPETAGAFGAFAVLKSSAKDPNLTNNVASATCLVHGVSQPEAFSSFGVGAADLVWDASSSRLFASVGSASPVVSNSLIVLDPWTGTFEPPTTLDPNPEKLAVSSDGQFLYIGHHTYVIPNGTGQVSRLRISSRKVDLRVPLPDCLVAADLEVWPGRPDSFIAQLQKRWTYGTDYVGIAGFRGDQQLPLTYAAGAYSMTCSTDGSRLYGSYQGAGWIGLRCFDLRTNGLAMQKEAVLLTGWGPMGIEFEAGRIYTSWGAVVDPEALIAVTNIGGVTASFVAPDAHGRVVSYLGSAQPGLWSVWQCSLTNYSMERQVRVPGVRGTPTRFVSWGATNVAFITTSNELFVVRPFAAEAELAMQALAWPAQAFAGRPIELVFSVTNRGPYTAVDTWVTNSIPAQASLLNVWSTAGTNMVAASNVVFHLGDVPAATSLEFRVRYQPNNTNVVYVSYGATVASACFDRVPTNNSFQIPGSFRVDSDGDEMADDWEVQYFTDLLQMPSADYDADGVSNLEEYWEGTNPASALSFRPRLRVLARNGTVLIEPFAASYLMGSRVKLAATAAAGYEFVEWSGSASGYDNPITVTLTNHKVITANFRVPGDDFVQRVRLSGPFTTGALSSEAATREATEPEHAGKLGGKSVWWTWTAPVAGPVSVTTEGTDFSNLLAVYTGTSLSNLVAVAGGQSSPGTNIAHASFVAARGSTYHIAVDGTEGGGGNVKLSLTMPEVVVLQTPQVVNGQLQFALMSIAGTEWRIEASTNLQSWAGVGVVTNLNGTVTFAIVPGEGSSFYRAAIVR